MDTNLSANDPNPPIEQGPLDTDERLTKWPKVIGIIGIILSSLGLTCGCMGYFALPLQRWGLQMSTQGGQSNPMAEAQVRVGEQFHLLTNVLLTFGMLMTVVLLVGSIFLLQRRRKARPMLIAWAAIGMLLFACNMALQILIFKATAAELVRMGEGQHTKELWIGAAIGGFFGVLFGISLQLFVLIWFSRNRIVEEIQQWP